jgi:tetratricopeptide (TPR) repeat protein
MPALLKALFRKQQYFHTMQFLALFLFITFSACGQQTKNYSVNPKAKQLNDSAVFIAVHSNNYDSAITLLDKAISIDSNFTSAYANKTFFQLQLNQFDTALLTSKKLLGIKPNVPEYIVMTGMICEKLSDTISSREYFTQAAIIYDNILDTMSKTNKNYDGYLMNKAVNLIFLEQQQKGNDILKQVYNDKRNEADKELISMFINKSKQEIIDSIIQTK